MIEPVALTERHFSIKEIAEAWGLSPLAIRRLFRDEPGVLRFGKQKRGHQRDYVTLRIPLRVAEKSPVSLLFEIEGGERGRSPLVGCSDRGDGRA